MGAPQITIRPLGEPGDLGWVVMAHGTTYWTEFGWDTSFEALVATIVAGYAAGHDPAREAAWIAEVDGRRAGCVFCVASEEDAKIALLRILLVDPAARGHRLGSRLVDECLSFARRAGYRRMRLWTYEPLAAAREIYLSRGFRVIAQEPHHRFGVDLLNQTYELALSPGDRPAARPRPAPADAGRPDRIPGPSRG